MIMFVSAPRPIPENFNSVIYSGLLFGMLFTEIDHNYVNPTSDKYKSSIESALKNRSQWVIENNITNNYSSEYSVFNEYMTHALFCVYVKEKFKSENAKTIIENRIDLMRDLRGFYRFESFTKYFIKLKENNQHISIESLYPEIIKWFEKVN